ncbi:MAG: DNA-directed RNA polymerase subunit D, partial [Thermoproteota archaeon]
MLKVEITEKSGDRLKFIVRGVHPSFANALRRT